jgi:protein gp37
MGKTSIEWTDKSWNAVTGCDTVSPGCNHCYARTMAERFRGVPGNAYEQGFDLKLWPNRLTLPLTWRKPTKIFVNSMSDWLHKDIPDDYILAMFDTMVKADWHIYQLLTKRPSRLVNTSLLDKILSRYGTWPAHIWHGTSIENNDYVWRVEKLTAVFAPIHFISAEPLLGPLTDIDLTNVQWLITGAESGHGARPMNEDWVRQLRDLCQKSGTSFFYKQNAIKGHKIPTPELDGRKWEEYPEVAINA